MDNTNKDFFVFENNDELEQTKEFNYSSIGGLGESDYENEDLFNTDEVNLNFYNETPNDGISEPDNYAFDGINNFNFSSEGYDLQNDNFNINDYLDSKQSENSDAILQEDLSDELELENNKTQEQKLDDVESNYNNIEYESVDSYNYDIKDKTDHLNPDAMVLQENLSDVSESLKEDSYIVDEIPVVEENYNEYIKEIEESDEVEEKPTINISDTSIEELNKLTEYETEEIETTDINSLFDRVSVNVKDASDIFRKNTEMKQKIDFRFDELKKLQSEVELSRKTQIDEINNYKEEVLNKLTEKKEEIEKRLNTLKELQATLEQEKKEFEEYKKAEKQKIEKVQKEVQAAYDDRREELSHIEDTLRRQKDALDEERNQLSLDKIQYESDKNDLANNLLKFNELVNSFTSGVNGVERGE